MTKVSQLLDRGNYFSVGHAVGQLVNFKVMESAGDHLGSLDVEHRVFCKGFQSYEREIERVSSRVCIEEQNTAQVGDPKSVLLRARLQSSRDP
jgi:hypothetical protein